MTNVFAKSIDRRGFLYLAFCVGMFAAAGCGSEEAETIDAPVKAGNKSRLAARGPQSKGAVAKAEGGSSAKKADETAPKKAGEAP